VTISRFVIARRRAARYPTNGERRQQIHDLTPECHGRVELIALFAAS
jgi:hypothetical protein